MRDREPETTAITCDLAAVTTGAAGAAWSCATQDLNATVLAWPARHEVAEHVNEERDVLLVGISGAALVVVDGVEHELRPATMVVVSRGARRSLRASDSGVAYLSAHAARGMLQVRPRYRR